MGVYKDALRGTWFVKKRYRDENGVVKTITKRGFTKKADALAYEREFLVNHSDDPTVTLEEFVVIYKNMVYPRIKKSTITTKNRIIDEMILPRFGKKKVTEITAMDITRWENDLLKQISPKTNRHLKRSYIKAVDNVFNEVLNYCVRYYGLKENPFSKVEKICYVDDRRIRFWTLEEFHKFIKVVDDPSAKVVFNLLYWTGMREGEMRALTRDDFDFDRNMVKISKTMHTEHGKDIITSPKTKKSNREITMPESLSADIREYMGHLSGLTGDTPLFIAPPYTLYRRMRKYCKKAGMEPIRIHDLRHSHVSLLISLHYNALEIAERMGHESTDITYVYAHMFPSEQIEIAEMLDQCRRGDKDVE